MKKPMRLSLVAGLIVLASAAPAYAQTSNRGNSDTPNRPTTAKERKEKAEPHVQQRTEKIKLTVEERKAELDLAKCERNQAKLERSIPRLSNTASKLLSVTDRMYERVQGFYESGQLTVSNYDEYVTAIDEKQLAATAAVETLKDFTFELNCEDEDAGEQLDGFRVSVNEARATIKDYRKELVSLISALRSEAAEGETDSTSDDASSADDSEGETETEAETEITESETE